MANTKSTFRKYGLDWPSGTELPFIDLTLAKKWMLYPYKHGNLLDPGEHMLRAIRALFTPEQWCITPWTEEHAHAWAGEDFSVWLGAASTGKSNDAGGLAVLDWITDPTETYIALASTSVPMLKLRSFESVLRYFRHLKRHPMFKVPGKEAPSQTAIINDNDLDENDATVKASIRGVALADGDSAKAVARLAGAHLPFVTMILDEGSALPETAANARINAMAGTRRFRYLSLANPVDKFDEATKFCVPVDGWGSVDEHTPKWRSRHGLVLHHNGFNSPAIDEPDKYTFLINQKQIDAILTSVGGNADDPLVWRMVIGFPAPQGSDSCVMSPSDLSNFKMQTLPVWDRGGTVLVGGLDPAFTSGGDKCMLQLADVGWMAPRIWGIAFRDPVQIPIEASNQRPPVYQISDRIKDICLREGLSLANLAVDDSGVQSVASVLSEELGGQPIRCNFASRATEMMASEAPQSVAKPRYKDLVTQMWYTVARMGREGRLRNFPEVAAQQFCSRRFRRGRVPLALESKEMYALRKAGHSPDEADALALCVHAACLLKPTEDARRTTFAELFAGIRKSRTLRMGYSEKTVDNKRYKNYAEP